MTGEINKLERKVEELEAERDALARELESERYHRQAIERSEQALAAHVALIRSWGECKGLKPGERWEQMMKIIDGQPTTSLARLKAEWQAGAFEAMAEEQEATNAAYPGHAEAYQLWRDIPKKLRDYAYRYRRQASEATHETDAP